MDRNEYNLPSDSAVTEQIKLAAEGKQLKPVFRVELTKRDFEILEFMLDMKFASAREVFEKYFKETLSGEAAKSIAWAKKRLLQLERGGFLRAIYSFYDSTRYYVVTRKGYQTLVSILPEKEFTNYSGGFDLRTFIHDREVLFERLRIESTLQASNWISDRRLRAGHGSIFGFSGHYIPDGVFTLPSGEKEAVEIEISRKSTRKYRDKISRYVKLIRERRGDPSMVKRVRFRCYQSFVFNAIQEIARIHPETILVELCDISSVNAGKR